MTCPRGSCAAAGYRACCTDGSACQGSAGCFCDYACTFFGDCCYDFEDLCPTSVGTVIGSCAAAGYTTCCDDGSECLGTPANCKCDAECRDHGDCCADIGSSCPAGRKFNKGNRVLASRITFFINVHCSFWKHHRSNE